MGGCSPPLGRGGFFGPLRVGVSILADLHPGSTPRSTVVFKLTRFTVTAVLHSAGGVEFEPGCIGSSFDCLRMIQNNTCYYATLPVYVYLRHLSLESRFCLNMS